MGGLPSQSALPHTQRTQWSKCPALLWFCRPGIQSLPCSHPFKMSLSNVTSSRKPSLMSPSDLFTSLCPCGSEHLCLANIPCVGFTLMSVSPSILLLPLMASSSWEEAPALEAERPGVRSWDCLLNFSLGPWEK